MHGWISSLMQNNQMNKKQRRNKYIGRNVFFFQMKRRITKQRKKNIVANEK